MATILCVDDEPAVGVVLEHALRKIGHRPLLAGSVEEAMNTVSRTAVDLIIADYRMPGATGLDLLGLLEKEGLQIPLIVMTGHSSIEHAVTAIKMGAIDYLTKPVRAETLSIAIDHALEVVRLRRENDEFRREISSMRTAREIVGDADSIRRILESIRQVAPARATVLLEGESGTGKELFARAIHEQSPRHNKPLVTVNCAALPEGLVESALFGHEKGAFTGATERAAGAFERANGGTLLLDEISELRLELQAKLLRVLQEQEFLRVGGQQLVRVDVRIVATTNRDLKQEVEAGHFRSDLYYRLNVVPLRSPPLRERVSDIPLLVHHFVRASCAEKGVPAMAVPAATVNMLQRRAWPGNVRELQNAVERAVIMSTGAVLEPDAFSFLESGQDSGGGGSTGAADGKASAHVIPPDLFNIGEIEMIMIHRALADTGGNRTRAAKLLGISERTIRNKLNKKKTANHSGVEPGVPSGK